MLLNLSAAQEFGRGRAYRADLLGKFGKFNVQAQSFFVDGGFISGLVGENERSAHSLQVDTIVKPRAQADAAVRRVPPHDPAQRPRG